MAYTATATLLGTGVFDQTLIPYRAAPQYMRLVNTDAKARNYAAAAYHVSVSRGEGGGCGSSAAAVGYSPNTVCPAPLGRADLSALWEQAVVAYRNAYNRLGTVAEIRNELLAANLLADAAYTAEHVAPPVDPANVPIRMQGMTVLSPVPTEPFVVRSTLGAKMGLAAAGIGIIGAILAATYDVGEKK